jgi:hypothetical protein
MLLLLLLLLLPLMMLPLLLLLPQKLPIATANALPSTSSILPRTVAAPLLPPAFEQPLARALQSSAASCLPSSPAFTSSATTSAFKAQQVNACSRCGICCVVMPYACIQGYFGRYGNGACLLLQSTPRACQPSCVASGSQCDHVVTHQHALPLRHSHTNAIFVRRQRPAVRRWQRRRARHWHHFLVQELEARVMCAHLHVADAAAAAAPML